MYCSKCGKQISDESKFCINCGEPVHVSGADNAGTEQWECNNSTVDTTSTLEDVEKRDSTQKLKGYVFKAGIALIILIFALVMKNKIMEVLDGKERAINLINIPFVFCIFISIFVHVYAEIVIPIVGRKSVIKIQELSQIFYCESYQKLFSIASNCSCLRIKKVAYDELGCVLIDGKLTRYTLVIEDGKVNIVCKKNNYRTATEAYTIMAYLLKQSNPNANINAIDIEKENTRNANLYRYSIIGLVVSFAGFLIVTSIPTKDKYITFVTDAVQSDYNVTYGEAFENYFDEEEWIYFDYEGRDIVEFDGIKESEKYVVQFELFYDEGYFNLYTIEIDNEPQNELVQAIIMTAIFTNSDTTESINDVVETTVVEEVEEGNISIGNFLGTWQDSYSQRCSMNITELDDGTYVSIDWANSASDGYLWTYYVENVDNGALWCTQGIKEYYYSTEGGELEYGTEYVDGTATLWIDSEGILHWEDNVLNEGAECLFENMYTN